MESVYNQVQEHGHITVFRQIEPRLTKMMQREKHREVEKQLVIRSTLHHLSVIVEAVLCS